MRQYLTLKPWVFFAKSDPATVLSATFCKEVIDKYYSRDDALAFLWRSYGEYLLTANEVPLEVNDSAASILGELYRYPVSDGLAVNAVRAGTYELTFKGAKLYLEEAGDGDVFLSFFSPWSRHFREEMGRLDLTGYGRTTSGYFLATLLECLDPVRDYMDSLRISA